MYYKQTYKIIDFILYFNKVNKKFYCKEDDCGDI